jgi:O-antigen/teichoic acid export membrane protein
MFNKLKNFFKISFVRDVATLQIGTLISVSLTVIASIVFARILQPEGYGIYALIFALAGLIGLFMNVGATQACLTLLSRAYAKKDKLEIKNILTYFIKINLLVIGIVGVIGIIFAPLISDLLYHNSRIGQLARWVLLGNVLAICFLFLTISLQSIRRIKYLAILEVLNKFFYKLLPIIFVLLGFGLLGLVFGYFLSAILFLIFSIFIYSYWAQRNEYLPSWPEIFLNFSKIKLKKYFHFGFLIAIDKNLARIYTLLPILFLGMFAPSQDVGFFNIAFGYVTVPTLLLGAISRLLSVQLPKSQVYGSKQLKSHFFKTTLYSGLISIILMIPLIILAPYLINLFYGSAYQSSIPLVYYLALYPIFIGFGVGLGPVFRTINRVDVAIKIHLLTIVLGLPLVFYLIKTYLLMGVVYVAIFWALAPIILNLIFLIRYFKKPFNDYEDPISTR